MGLSALSPYSNGYMLRTLRSNTHYLSQSTKFALQKDPCEAIPSWICLYFILLPWFNRNHSLSKSMNAITAWINDALSDGICYRLFPRAWQKQIVLNTSHECSVGAGQPTAGLAHSVDKLPGIDQSLQFQRGLSQQASCRAEEMSAQRRTRSPENRRLQNASWKVLILFAKGDRSSLTELV